MLPRSLAFAGLLGAAAGAPYLASKAPDGWASNWLPASSSAESPDAAPLQFYPPNASAPEGPGASIYASPAPLEGPVGQPLEQLFRWEIDRNWVYRQWARKSTGLADADLFGVRAPLVTGYGMTDIAGSVSYYFNKGGALERIRFHGRTADTTRLVQLATGQFGMRATQPEIAGEQLFRAVERGGVRGELRTRPEGVLWGSSPHSSFLVDLEVNRPGSASWVEPERPPALPQSGPLQAGQPVYGADGQVVASQPPPADAGRPFLPPRSLVPDRTTPPPTAAQNVSAAQQYGVRAAGQPAPARPAPIGSPTEAPRSNIKPLDGYRDLFRWPN